MTAGSEVGAAAVVVVAAAAAVVAVETVLVMDSPCHSSRPLIACCPSGVMWTRSRVTMRPAGMRPKTGIDRCLFEFAACLHSAKIENYSLYTIFYTIFDCVL